MKTSNPQSAIRHFCLASAIIAGIASLPAAPVIYEPFAQTAGSISGKAGGTGLNSWAIVSTAPTVATTPTLAYGLLPNSAGQVSVPTAASAGAYVTTTSALADAGLLADGATLWFSFVYSKAAGGGANERSGFAFGTDELTLSGTAGASMSNLGNGLGIYSNNQSIVPIAWRGGGGGTQGSGTTFAAYGDTVMIVGRITWGANSSLPETLRIWTPDETSLPESEVGLGTGWAITMPGVDQTLFDTISMHQRNSNGAQIYDEIRFGASYQDVVDSTPTTAFWDLNDTTPGAGAVAGAADGTWDESTTPNWGGVADGSGSATTWTAGRTSVFSAGTDANGVSAVTVSGTPQIGGLRFEEGNVTLAGGTALDLVTAGGAIVVGPLLTETIATPISQTTLGGALSKEGAGTLTLSGDNTFDCPMFMNGGVLILSGDNSGATGSMTLSGGVTQFNSTLAIPGSGTSVTIGNYGVAMFGSALDNTDIGNALARIAPTSPGVIAADNNAGDDFDLNTAGLTAAYFGAVGDVTYTGTLTPNGNYRLGGAGGTLTLSANGAVAGAGKTLTVNGPGTVVLSGTTSYTGTTTINSGATLAKLASSSATTTTLSTGGTFIVGHANATGGAAFASPVTGNLILASNLTVGGGGVFFSTGASIRSDGTTPRTFAGKLSGNANNRVVLGDRVNNGKLTFTTTAPALSSSATVLQCDSDVEFTLGWAASGGGPTKQGPGTMILSGANLFTGAININQGTVKVDAGAGGSLNGATGTALTFLYTGTGSSGGQSGGVFEYDNTTAIAAKAQGMGALTFSAGEGTIKSTRTAAQDVSLTFASLAARPVGATGNFMVSGGTNGTENQIVLTGAATGALLDPGLFFGGSSFAACHTPGNYVRAYGSGDANYVSLATDTTFGTRATTDNVTLTGDITAEDGETINTLNLGGNSLTINDGAIVNVKAVLLSGSSTAAITTGATGGIRGVGASGELVVRVDGSSDKLELGRIANSTATPLTKSGAGTLVLTAANAYTGATKLNAGTLLVNGSTGAGAVTVASGATLGGSGTVGGAVTLNSDAIIQPSVSGAVNTLTLSSSTSPVFNIGSVLGIRVPTSSTTDKVSLSNASANFNCANLNLVIDTTGMTGNASGLTIAQTTKANGVTGTFASVTANNGYLASVTYNANSITVDLTATGGTPTIIASGTLAAVDTTYGTASPTPTSFTVSGSDLTGSPGNLTVTPPSGYEVSLSSGSGYNTSLSVPYATATLSATTVYVRLAATTGVGSYSGDIEISGGGATSETIATVSSTVSARALTFTGTKPYDGNASATAAQLVFGNNLDGGNLTKSGSVTLAGSAAGSQTITDFSGLSLGGSAAGNYTLTGASGTVTIQIPYDTWAGGYGLQNPWLGVDPLLNGEAGANPDGDAFTNLKEFAFAFNPTVSDGSGPLTISGVSITQNGPPQIYEDPVTHQFFLRYTRRTDHATAGLTYTAQFAADSLGAGSFQNVAGGSVVATGTGVGGVAIEAVSIEFPDALPVSGKKARYGRVEVTQTP